MSDKTARLLRINMTDAERKLWSLVRRKQLQGFRFRRQVPLGRDVADFACMSARLVIELDGGQHAARSEYDQHRTAWLNGNGFRVLRFWNDEVFTNADGVLETIRLALVDLPPQPSPARGELVLNPSPLTGEGYGRGDGLLVVTG